MEFENTLLLPHAHQQIRLGDGQAFAHKWSTAIEYYLHAIEYFNAIQNTLQDDRLISIIKAQIVQCEKTIHLCRLKDRSEQAAKEQHAEYLSKLTRAHSTSSLKISTKTNSMTPRHNTIQSESIVILGNHGEVDSCAAIIFSKTNSNETDPIRTLVIAKKNTKHDSHKIEELQMSYEALKTHLKAAFDDIERLKHENNELRVQRETNMTQSTQDS